MKKSLFKIPLLTSAAGIILRIADRIVTYALVRATFEWTLEMGRVAFYIHLVLCAAAFAAIGMLLRKDDKSAVAASATLLVSYSAVILAIEQIIQRFVAYNFIINWFFIPVDIFTVITSALAGLSAEKITLAYAIPALFAPYLFVLFGKRAEKGAQASL